MSGLQTSEPPAAPATVASVAGAVRAFGVVFGGSAALDLAAGAALVASARAIARGSRVPPPAAAGLAAIAAYVAAARPWMGHWGMRPGEGVGHAVEIDAPPEAVWPWLAQMGQDRGGFYSYEWLENLAGCRMRNADRIHPEWQDRARGEPIKLHWAYGVPLSRWEPGRALAIQGWGSFELTALGGGRSRLIARPDATQGLGRAFYELLVAIPHFVMERKMLLGIKQRAESGRTR